MFNINISVGEQIRLAVLTFDDHIVGGPDVRTGDAVVEPAGGRGGHPSRAGTPLTPGEGWEAALGHLASGTGHGIPGLRQSRPPLSVHETLCSGSNASRGSL